MASEKKRLTTEELESQAALELPERETLDTFVANCVAVCVGGIQVKDVNVSAEVAAQVCANLNAALALLLSVAGAGQSAPRVECTVEQATNQG
jgi:hypothetical protein